MNQASFLKALASIDDIKSSDLYAIAAASIQKEFDGARDVVHGLAQHVVPSVVGTTNAFYTMLLDRATWFFVHRSKPNKAGAVSTTRGRNGIQKAYDDLEKASETTKPTLGQLNEVMPFSWVLTQQCKDRLTQWSKDAFKEMGLQASFEGSQPANTKGASSSSKGPQPSSSSSSSAAAEKLSVMSFFG